MFVNALFRNFRCRVILMLTTLLIVSTLFFNALMNTHRLIVRGVRSPEPETIDASRSVNTFLNLKDTDIDLNKPCYFDKNIPNPVITTAKGTTLRGTTPETQPEEVIQVQPETITFPINPRKACRDPTLKTLIYIHSAPSNIERRRTIRRTWGQRSIMKSLNAKIIFIMGETNSTDIQKQIVMESNNFYNIIQASFHDSYRNLTIKAIAAVKWMTTYCNRVPYVVKLDDDVVVNVFNLTKYIANATRTTTKNIIYCNVWAAAKVIRSVNHKHFVRNHEFPSGVYPPYCAGAAVFFTGDVMAKLYNASISEPYFWLDDVFLTGILTSKIRLLLTDTSKEYKFERTLFNSLKRNEEYSAIFTHAESIKEMYILWNFLKLRHSHDLMRTFYRLSMPSEQEKMEISQKIKNIHIL